MEKSKKIKPLYFIVPIVTISLFYYKDKLLQVKVEGLSYLLKKLVVASKLSEFSLNFFVLNLMYVLLALIFEVFVLGWDKSSFKRIVQNRDRSTKGDVICWLLSVISLYDFFVLIFSFGIFYVLCSLIVNTFDINFSGYIHSNYLKIFILFLLNDLKHYVWHWFMHKLKPFWSLHQYHHSATNFNMITNSRGHFLEKGIHTVFDAIVFVLFGMPPEMFIYLVIAREIYQLFLHSNIKWNFGFVGDYILVSPAAHKLHHSQKQRDFDKNFGTFFIFWDRLFGTYSKPRENIEIGLDNDPYNSKSFWIDMLNGSKNFIIELGNSFIFNRN